MKTELKMEIVRQKETFPAEETNTKVGKEKKWERKALERRVIQPLTRRQTIKVE